MAIAPEPDWRLALVLALLVVTAASTSRLAGLGVERDHVTAAARAVLQLAVVAVVIGTVMDSLSASLAFVLLMFATASVTSHRRIGASARRAHSCLGPPWRSPRELSRSSHSASFQASSHSTELA